MSESAGRNQVKPDTILKNFWKNNQRFADLFNTVLFGGDTILKPNDLKEVDTDISSVVKFNGHVETVQRILDVVRKTAYGVDFVIWGLENQEKIHYAMPLRHMVGDSLIYLKEYNEIAAKNKKEKNYDNADEFLSALKKEDRLHPVISLCIYYGEKEWDGPYCLRDMLVMPEYVKSLVSDYKMNLIQIRKSEELHFQNEDINIVFDMIRSIYNKDYNTFHRMYKDKVISTELGLTVGSVVNSQAIIDQVLRMEEKRRGVDMCEALERWWDEAVEKGIQKGREEGIQKGREEGIQKGREEGIQKGVAGTINTCKKFHISEEETKKNLMEEFKLSEEEAREYMEEYWS